MANYIKGLIPLFATGGAGALTLSPDDAEAAKIPNYDKIFQIAFEKGTKKNLYAGTLEPKIYEQVKAVHPDAQNQVMQSVHNITQRTSKDGWSAQRSIEAAGDVLDDGENGVVVKNWADKGGKNDAKHGILRPFEIDPTFTPFFVGDNGEIIFKTTFSPSYKNMRKAGYGVEGGNPLISTTYDSQIGRHSSQRQPVSVVTTGPALENRIRGLDKLSNLKKGDDPVSGFFDVWSSNKKAIPWMVGTGAGTGVTFYPSTADAGGVPQYPEEPGLESPFFDPVDILLAPIGAATSAGKALSVMAEPFISYGMDKLGGLVGRMWSD